MQQDSCSTTVEFSEQFTKPLLQVAAVPSRDRVRVDEPTVLPFGKLLPRGRVRLIEAKAGLVNLRLASEALHCGRQ